MKPAKHHRLVQLAFALLVITFLWALATMPSHAIEEPPTVGCQKIELFEVRLYAPYLAAEMVVAGPANEANSLGFNLLGNYIFGGNKGERKLEMTASVTQTPLAPLAPVKLDMKAPEVKAL